MLKENMNSRKNAQLLNLLGKLKKYIFFEKKKNCTKRRNNEHYQLKNYFSNGEITM